MIPVFQTRYAVETFGNCFEACLASILELPLSAIPDRAALVDQDAWANLVARTAAAGGDVGDLDLPARYDDGVLELKRWLWARGLGWIELEIGPKDLSLQDWLGLAAESEGFWVGDVEQTGGWAHSLVWKGGQPIHNPARGAGLGPKEVGRLLRVNLLVAWDPAKAARELGPLPDIAGAVERIAA